jgi:DnaJ-class molecular chaperone
MGKGDLPREGQYSKKSQSNYEKGYERAFGVKCTACKGKGYLWLEYKGTPMAKGVCENCNGTGKLKG